MFVWVRVCVVSIGLNISERLSVNSLYWVINSENNCASIREYESCDGRRLSGNMTAFNKGLFDYEKKTE